MPDNNSLSRRQFVAAASAGLVLANSAGAAYDEAETKTETVETAASWPSRAARRPSRRRAATSAWASPSAGNSMRCSGRTRSSTGKGRKPGC